MISVAFVGLCLTSFPNVLRTFHRPLRPDVPLAPYLPAWVDSDYGPVAFPVDKVLEALEPQAAVVTTTDISDFAGLGAETSIEDASLVSISYSLSTVLTDPELDDQEWNSLAAGCTMDDLVYHTVVDGTIHDIAETNHLDNSGVAPSISSTGSPTFEGPECKATENELGTVTTPATILRADAPEFRLPIRLLDVEPLSPTPVPALRVDAPVFTPRSKPAVLTTPLRKDAPEFKARSALALAYEARGPSNVTSTRDAKDLACASRMGFVTPKKVLRLEAPLNRDVPAFSPRSVVLQAAYATSGTTLLACPPGLFLGS